MTDFRPAPLPKVIYVAISERWAVPDWITKLADQAKRDSTTVLTPDDTPLEGTLRFLAELDGTLSKTGTEVADLVLLYGPRDDERLIGMHGALQGTEQEWRWYTRLPKVRKRIKLRTQ